MVNSGLKRSNVWRAKDFVAVASVPSENIWNHPGGRVIHLDLVLFRKFVLAFHLAMSRTLAL
jgi:hypothetical protein